MYMYTIDSHMYIHVWLQQIFTCRHMQYWTAHQNMINTVGPQTKTIRLDPEDIRFLSPHNLVTPTRTRRINIFT